MDIKPDIQTRDDIKKFIIAFYDAVKTDETIGIIFTKVVEIHWEHHIELITDFWESILLDNPVYKNNAMGVHYNLNSKYPLQKKHFDAWLLLFNNCLDKMYSGRLADLAKKRAKGIADLLLFKMSNPSML
ncbi:MAG TPA: group III truncated hemoglobin [Ferruginibacter sp.]|nr:group III truncated hemoglobin [Ferruginibacter sp.]HRE64106.1 group III truncated hemoglobin [Ferruginibacter sp.]